MPTETYTKGLKIRRDVLGAKYVDNAIASADEFNQPMQDLETEYCWGSLWGREEFPRNRPHELRLHLRGALTNGVSKEEIREVFLQVAIYCGVPSAIDAFRTAKEVFAEHDSK